MPCCIIISNLHLTHNHTHPDSGWSIWQQLCRKPTSSFSKPRPYNRVLPSQWGTEQRSWPVINCSRGELGCLFFFFLLSSYWELVDSLPYCPGQPLMGACSSSAKNWGWPVTWRSCLNGSTFLTQKPTPDAKLAARVYQISLHRHFVRASSRPGQQ